MEASTIQIAEITDAEWDGHTATATQNEYFPEGNWGNHRLIDRTITLNLNETGENVIFFTIESIVTVYYTSFTLTSIFQATWTGAPIPANGKEENYYTYVLQGKSTIEEYLSLQRTWSSTSSDCEKYLRHKGAAFMWFVDNKPS